MKRYIVKRYGKTVKLQFQSAADAKEFAINIRELTGNKRTQEQWSLIAESIELERKFIKRIRKQRPAGVQ